MGYKILNLLVKIFPGLRKLGREEEDEPSVVLYNALPITSEQLYHQDKLKRASDKDDRETQAVLERAYRTGRLKRPERPAPDRLTRRGLL